MNEQIRWPPDYVKLFAWRQGQLRTFRKNPNLLAGAKFYYKTHPIEFICDWVDTYDPRNAGQSGKMVRMPFMLFPRQKDMVRFLYACLNGEADGLVEKCRDAGATWVCVAFSVWLWLFWDGAAVGWGSRKEDLVDKLGIMDSIFEKLRAVIRGLPREFLPEGFSEKDHLTYMRCINPANGATILGESGNNIGRGGRTRIYFKDESAHYERPELIEAALGDNTRVQIDISSVNGLGNVFHRKREAGVEWEGGEAVKGKTNIFVFDWSDHPEKTFEWYEARRKKAEEEGMLHIFAQEVDRDYASSVQGIVIPAAWVTAAIDAHKRLDFTDDGQWVAGLDVADEGTDLSALAQRKGVVLKHCENWGQVDTGKTARRALHKMIAPSQTWLMYDSIGVGAGCKAEFNRLEEEGLLPPGLRIEPWAASAAVLFPEETIIRDDPNTPINKDYYANLKAQAWMALRQRFWNTFQAVTESKDIDTEELISIDSDTISPQMLVQLKKELSQATSSLSPAKLKVVIDKAPDGTRSPNMADAVVMAFWPVLTTRYTLDFL